VFVTLKFLHILSMFVATTLLFAPDLIFYRAARARDVDALRRIGAVSKAVVNTGIVTFFVGMGFGFLAALTGGFYLTAPWLITAYIIVVVLILLGAVVESPHFTRIAQAAERSGERFSPELERLVESPIRHLTWLSVVLYGAVIYTMVAKPFS
jgi:uncharacterized membrane protein SirB2